MAAEEELLKSIGLTENESKIYLALLKLRSALAGQLTKETGVHRRNVYDSLERLVQKGLVSYVMQGTRRYFVAEKPERLVEIMQYKIEDLKEIVPKLKSQYESVSGQEARIYRGKRGLKTLMDDQIATGENICIFGAYGNLDNVLQYFFPQFEKRRLRAGIKVKLVFDENEKARAATKYPLVQARFLPKNFSGPVATDVYGDKVALIVWTDPILVTLIESKELANAYRNYFDILWRAAKK